jgi:8-oxo-dGTP pyrophosphatase MutT (NUDIX family)
VCCCAAAAALLFQFETSAECAARECLEEGGVEGRLLCALTGVDFSSKKGRPSRLQPYLLQATVEHTHWAEEGLRQRQWVRAEEVERTLRRAETVAVWNDVKEQLRRLGYMDEQGRARFIEPPLQDAPISVADIAAADSASSSPSSDDAATTGEAKSPL